MFKYTTTPQRKAFYFMIDYAIKIGWAEYCRWYYTIEDPMINSHFPVNHYLVTWIEDVILDVCRDYAQGNNVLLLVRLDTAGMYRRARDAAFMMSKAEAVEKFLCGPGAVHRMVMVTPVQDEIDSSLQDAINKRNELAGEKESGD